MSAKKSLPSAAQEKDGRSVSTLHPANDLPADSPSSRSIVLTQRDGEEKGEVMARAMIGPGLRHGAVAAAFAGKMLGNSGEALSLMDAAAAIDTRAADAAIGDLAAVSAMLMSQAVTCDQMFTEFARRAGDSIGEHNVAMERYARLAFKAQSNSRATMEALVKMHQPREQVVHVRHVQVNAGGQAVVTEEFHHHHAGGLENAIRVHEPRTQATSGSEALSCFEPLGKAVPGASGEG